MKKINKAISTIAIASMMLFASGCDGLTSAKSFNTVIEKSTLDTTVENVNVDLSERARYQNPISETRQPMRADSLEDQLARGVENPIEDTSRTGDPYILRYNGKFYLYCSTDGWYTSYRVWESLDLVNYLYLGEYQILNSDGTLNRTTKTGATVAEDTGAGQNLANECPWAPEVHYWNGGFYMYTSPHASGHQVFKSTTGLPYGDFICVNEKLQNCTEDTYPKKIDGSVFIDDNEDKWFVFSSKNNDKEAWAAVSKLNDDMVTLESPSTYQETTKTGITGSQVEGPFIFKRDGVYYTIATGEPAGYEAYRITYSYNETGLNKEDGIGTVNKKSAWTTEYQPEILLNTQGDYFGYGHGAVTIGPDLDSYWLPYHVSRATNRVRTLAIHRLEFSGSRMTALGQDLRDLQEPNAPDFYTSYFEGGRVYDGKQQDWIDREAGFKSYTDERTESGEGLYWNESQTQILSSKKTANQFTAEYNFKNVPLDGSFKCLFGGGYVTLVNNPDGGAFIQLYKGTTKVGEGVIKADLDLSTFHSVTVSYKDGRAVVKWNNLEKIDIAVDGFGNAEIGFEGLSSESEIGGAVFSNYSFGSSDCAEAKPVEGTFYANNYYVAKDGESATVLSENSSVFRVKAGKGEDDYSFSLGNFNTALPIYDGASALKLAEGDRAVYKIDVVESGLYAISSMFSTDSDGSVIKIQIDDKTPTCYTLKKNDYSSLTYEKEYYEALKYQKRLIDEIYLEKGMHTFTVKAVQGDYTAIEYQITRTSEYSPKYSNDLSEKGGHDYFSNWTVKEGAHFAASTLRSLVQFGNNTLTDYSMKVSLKTNAMLSGRDKAGVIVRLDNPSVYHRQHYGSGLGYFVYLDFYGVAIERIDYGTRLVATYETKLSVDEWYDLQVDCIDNTLLVKLDGKEVLRYVDPYCFTQGSMALFSYQAETYYKNLEIKPL